MPLLLPLYFPSRSSSSQYQFRRKLALLNFYRYRGVVGLMWIYYDSRAVDRSQSPADGANREICCSVDKWAFQEYKPRHDLKFPPSCS